MARGERALAGEAVKALNRWAGDVQRQRERILNSLKWIGGVP
jgi:hypothetical protein